MWSPYETRIAFLPELDVMEVDFATLRFADAQTVNAFYDEVERQLGETGRKWFFLVKYEDCEIAPDAWSAFAHRGKRVNLAYSLGSVRYGATAETQSEIAESAKVERFDANLFTTRDAALARIAELRKAHVAAHGAGPVAAEAPGAPNPTFARRIAFHDDIRVMEADLSDFTFEDSETVNAFYDELERQITETGKKWWFLINYRGCRIYPEAWIAHAHRGKRLNVGFSLGSVRYDASEENRAEIRKRAGTDNFDANLVGSREDGLTRIKEMRAARRSAS